MQVVKALARECVKNKEWNSAFISALKELGVDVEIPVEVDAKYPPKDDSVSLSGVMEGGDAIDASRFLRTSVSATETATVESVADGQSGRASDGSDPIGINPASNLPKGEGLIGVKCFVWGEVRDYLGIRSYYCDRTIEQRHTAILTHYDPTKGYSWGSRGSWFSNAVPVWFGDPAEYEEVTEGPMIADYHQFNNSLINESRWETVNALAGSDASRYNVRRRRDGRSFREVEPF